VAFMKLASMIYLPGLAVAPERTAAALANLAQFKHRYPIHFYSEADWHPSAFLNQGDHTFTRIDNPEVVKQEKNTVTVPKYVYLSGLAIMEAKGADFYLTLETDSRIYGDYWDEAIYAEMFDANDNPILAGTIFSWAPLNEDLDHANEFTDFFCEANAKFKKLAIKVPAVYVYGGKGSCNPAPQTAYPNGCLSICRTAFAREAFGYQGIIDVALEPTQWDPKLGYELFKRYGRKAYDRVVPLTTVLSLYGDLLTNEVFRQRLLLSGQVRGVHQIKSGWTP